MGMATSGIPQMPMTPQPSNPYGSGGYGGAYGNPYGGQQQYGGWGNPNGYGGGGYMQKNPFFDGPDQFYESGGFKGNHYPDQTKQPLPKDPNDLVGGDGPKPQTIDQTAQATQTVQPLPMDKNLGAGVNPYQNKPWGYGGYGYGGWRRNARPRGPEGGTVHYEPPPQFQQPIGKPQKPPIKPIPDTFNAPDVMPKDPTSAQ